MNELLESLLEVLELGFGNDGGAIQHWRFGRHEGI